MGALGPTELIIIGVVAILLFGKNLPDVARKLGKSYEQFRKGLQDIKNEVNDAAHGNTISDNRYSSENGDDGSSSDYDQDDFETPRAPRFEKPGT